MNKQELQDKLITILLNIINGNIADFYDKKGMPIPVHKLSLEQQMIIEEVGAFGRNLKVYNKLKAIEMLSRITGLNEIKHVIGADEDSGMKIDFNISFVTPEDKGKIK